MLIINPQIARRVLIADDDPVVRQLITAIIQKEGYAAVAVNNGREAYRRLQYDSHFSAAIFDMMMPHLQGLELIRYMRTENRLRRIPVMLITAETQLKLMAESFAAGATAFLQKPFSPEQLQSMVHMLISQGLKPEVREAEAPVEV